MYDFLDMELKYETLDEFQKFKANWLEESNYYVFNSKRSYWRILKKAHKTEEVKGKDLFDFDKQEIIQLVKYLPTKSITTKRQLYNVIVKYMEWACEKGYNYGGNPCDTIDTKELFTVNELAFKEQYIEISDFIKFMYDLDCSDVDRAMLTLLRYGVSIEDVGNVTWEDINADEKILRIHHENKELELPIDDEFLMMMKKSKDCHYRPYTREKSNSEMKKEPKMVSYLNSKYILKPLENASWEYMSGTVAYNKVGAISRNNQIQRISVPDLNKSRKYDLLFDIVDKNDDITMKDITYVSNVFEESTYTKAWGLRKNFEILSGYPVRTVRTVNGMEFKPEKKNNIELKNDFIDQEDNNYQNGIIEAFKDKDDKEDTSNYEYKEKPKKQKKKNDFAKIMSVRDARVGKKALQLANFQCEINKNHNTFISNTTLKNYVEAHHLIPMKYYHSDKFKYSIDNEANIVVLCPTCHRKLHFGQPEDKKELIRIMYATKIKKLEKANIYIKLDKLLELYVECSKDSEAE